MHRTALEDEALREQFKTLLGSVLQRPAPKQIDCPCCDAKRLQLARLRELRTKDFIFGHELVRHECPECGLVFGPVQLIELEPATMNRLYLLYYQLYEEGTTVLAQEKTFYLLNPSFRGLYLNYGCGYWFEGISRLKGSGLNLWGYDPHLDPVRRAELARVGLHTDLADIPFGQFHGVFSHNFLEHVQSPAHLFGEMAGLLLPGGRMAHSTPCFEYMFEGSPFHLYFYTGQSAQRLAERTGFEIEHRFEVERELPSYYQCVVVFSRRLR
jgi:SAM-dependent methyltransferase